MADRSPPMPWSDRIAWAFRCLKGEAVVHLDSCNGALDVAVRHEASVAIALDAEHHSHEATRTELTKARVDMAAQRGRADRAEQELAVARDRIPELQRLCDEQDRTLREGEAALKVVEASLADKGRVVEMCERDRRALADERDAAKSRVAELEAAVERLTAKLEDARRRLPTPAPYPGTLD